MRRHPEIGADILGSHYFDDVRAWILAHHERPDGKGYPYGLSGEEIPLEARIVAVADAYEAMTATASTGPRWAPRPLAPSCSRARGRSSTGGSWTCSWRPWPHERPWSPVPPEHVIERLSA